jgi:hypothetical protein
MISNTHSVYLGIDPGLSGALAFYDPITGDLEVFDVPVHVVMIAKAVKRRIDMHGLSAIVKARAGSVKTTVVEDVGAMPGQGVTSCFSFGFVAGAIQATIASHQIPLSLVRPAIWKKAMGLT